MLDPRKKTTYEIFESLRMYIERNGRPFNYLQPEQELFKQHINFYEQENQKIEEAKQQKIKREIDEKK